MGGKGEMVADLGRVEKGRGGGLGEEEGLAFGGDLS